MFKVDIVVDQVNKNKYFIAKTTILNVSYYVSIPQRNKTDFFK